MSILSKKKALELDSTPRRRGRPQSKREDIVTAAVEVFLDRGYAATSISEVAKEAGVIKATIYSHFKDKEQLFTAIIEEITVKKMQLDFEVMAKSLPDMSPRQFIERMHKKFSMLEKDPQYLRLVRILIGESARFPELPELYLKVVLLKGMTFATKYFEVHPELNIKDSFAAGHVVGGSFWSLLVWQQILGGSKIRPLESKRVKNLLIDLFESKLDS